MSNIDQATVANETPVAETTPRLREIPAGENFSAVTQYLGDRKVSAVFAIRRAEGKPRYEKKCLFDFSGVTEEQLYLLAMYGAKVKIQSRLRDVGEAEMLDPNTLATVDVLADVVQAPRNSVDSVTAAIRLLARKSGATEDDVREALASFVATE
jgi:homospermidine synthase